MKKKTKILLAVVIILIGMLVVAANIWRRQSRVRQVRVNIDYCETDTLVSGQQVVEYIQAKLPDLIGTLSRDVNLKEVDSVASKVPFLRDCQASMSVDGAVVVYAVQRRPVVRVWTPSEEYYLDDHGDRMPVSSHGSVNTIVGSGKIPAKGKGQQDVWKLACYLDQHPDLLPLFDQIYRDGKGNLFLTPKVGNHIVEIGSVDDLDDKFHRLWVFYTRGLPQVGWDTYRQVSVKYKGQVVCTKNE